MQVNIVIRGGWYNLKIISRQFKNICYNDIYDDIEKNMEQCFIVIAAGRQQDLWVQTQRAFSSLFQWATVIDDRLPNSKCKSIVIRWQKQH